MGLLLVPSQGKAFWEVPSLVAFGYFLRTPMGQTASLKFAQSMGFSKIVNDFDMSKKMHTFTSKKAESIRSSNLASYAISSGVYGFAQNFALAVSSAVKPMVLKLQTRLSAMKSVPCSTTSETITQFYVSRSDAEKFATRAEALVGGQPHVQGSSPQDVSKKAAPLGLALTQLQPAAMKKFLEEAKRSAYGDGDKNNQQESSKSSCGTPGGSTCNFAQFEATTINQHVSGFAKVTNNFNYGSSDETQSESGKKKFWQGMFVGSVATQWLYNKKHKQEPQ